MGKWSQYGHRGRAVATGAAPAPPPPPDPNLFDSPVDVNYLNWTWSGADPASWAMERSDDGVSGWGIIAGTAGNIYYLNVGIVDKYYRVRGYDAVPLPITPYSNVWRHPEP